MGAPSLHHPFESTTNLGGRLHNVSTVRTAGYTVHNYTCHILARLYMVTQYCCHSVQLNARGVVSLQWVLSNRRRRCQCQCWLVQFQLAAPLSDWPRGFGDFVTKPIAPQNCFGGGPEIWDLHCLSTHTFNHMWKFYGDRPSHTLSLGLQKVDCIHFGALKGFFRFSWISLFSDSVFLISGIVY